MQFSLTVGSVFLWCGSRFTIKSVKAGKIVFNSKIPGRPDVVWTLNEFMQKMEKGIICSAAA